MNLWENLAWQYLIRKNLISEQVDQLLTFGLAMLNSEINGFEELIFGYLQVEVAPSMSDFL